MILHNYAFWVLVQSTVNMIILSIEM